MSAFGHWAGQMAEGVSRLRRGLPVERRPSESEADSESHVSFKQTAAALSRLLLCCSLHYETPFSPLCLNLEQECLRYLFGAHCVHKQ